jgi:UDP-N-acetylmuramoyl-L-alanyl-D-glutamate--2,6-diaminopimelate ligase
MWQRLKNVYHLVRAIGANVWFRFPWRGMIVVGITGTDGKTTTSSLIYHILNNAGKKAALVTSVSAVINGKSYDIGFHVTTPRIFALRSYIEKARRLGVKYFVLETTSHALDQNRAFGIPFEVGVLTNVTHEHLDYHKTYQNYVKTKIKLFKMSKISITNRDDESYKLISNFKFLIPKLVTYGMKDNADINPKTFPFKTNLIGEFNKYNVLAAISVCRTLGTKDIAIRKGIGSFIPPKGREDIIYKKDFTVMIDFAHTPNAIDQILKAIRPNVKGRIIHVFGSAGARDVTKRPLMGKMSSKYADVIILTAEDPRREPVEKIMSEIESGVSKETKALKIADRKKAIKEAIRIAKKGDYVLVTGKSHEKSMNYGHGEEAWDEYAVVKKALKMND